MNRYSIKTIFTLILFVAFFAGRVEAQTALNAPPEDAVYQAIDQFIANGLVKDVIIGQRPYSRLEVARILKETRKKLDEEMTSEKKSTWRQSARRLARLYYLNRLLGYYEGQYENELKDFSEGVRADFLPRLDMSVLYNTSPPRAIPPLNGAGSIDGIVTSFDHYSQGITYVDGANLFVHPRHEFLLSHYVAIDAEPRFEIYHPADGEDNVHAHVHRLYLKSGWKNIELEIGRDNLLWGQGEYGGLMISGNARPLDMLKISNPYPFRLPWVLKYIGSMKLTFFVANLGPEQNFRYPYFYGLKWTIKPVSFIEFGLSETLIMGGESAPGVSFWDPLTEMFPFHKWGGRNVYAADISNHAFGFFDLRITIPPLWGSSVYYDGYIEDSIIRAFRLPDNLLNQLAFVVGWYSPRITYDGDLGIRFEYHHTPPLAYRHARWVSGYTEDRRVMGDPLGPDADGIYGALYWRPSGTAVARLDLAYEDYDSSTYYAETNDEGGLDRILKQTDGPHEKRWRATVGVDWRRNKCYGLKLRTGYERINNWNFNVGQSVNNALVDVGLSLYFDEFSIAR